MTDIKIKAAEHIPCNTESLAWDKLSDEALVSMERKLTAQEKDKLIVEALGECWHDTKKPIDWHPNFGTQYKCSKCGIEIWARYINPSLDTWEGFGWIWERAQKMEWWDRFMWEESLDHFRTWKYLVSPTRFRDALVEFLERRKG